MSTEPDPQLVREIAREHIRSGRSDIGTTVELMLIGTILDREDLAAWENAVQQAILDATVSWPDEQAQDGIDPYHGDMPDDDEFMDVMSGAASMYAEVTAFQRLVATVGVEQAYRKWSELLRRSERAEYQEEIDRLIGELAKAERNAQWSFRIADDGMTYACKLCGYMSSKFSDDLGEIVANCQRHHAHFHPGLPDSRQAERNTNTQTVPAGHGPGVPGAMHLEAFGQSIADAFGTCPYHVGSSATSKTWRDVDVRLILDDDRFQALFPGFAAANHIDPGPTATTATSEAAVTEPMSDERLAWIGEWAANVKPQDAFYGTMRRFMRELIDETQRARAELEVLRGRPQDAEPDLSGWTAEENARFEERYGVQAAMRLRASNDRVWQIVHELRLKAVEAGLNPYEDPMAQRLSAALVQPEPDEAKEDGGVSEPGDYRIGAYATPAWGGVASRVEIEHLPCHTILDDETDAAEYDLAAVLRLVEAHQCEANHE